MSVIPARARVVIVGGGVIGTSIAYHLGQLGWSDVVLLERDRLSPRSSSTARALGPMPEGLFLNNSATEAFLTPRHTPAPQGAERLASVHEAAIQRLSAVPSAPLTAEDRGAE